MALDIKSLRDPVGTLFSAQSMRWAIGLALLLASSAHAASEGPTPKPPEFLILGFVRDGKLVPAIRAAVANRISEHPAWSEKHPEMPTEELRCSWETCITLVERYGKPDYLVWGTIKKKDGPLCPDTNVPQDMTISVTAVNVLIGKQSTDSPEVKRTRDLSSCDPDAIAAETANLVQELLVGEKSAAAGSPRPGFVPPPPLCAEDLQRFGTGFAQGAFAGLGASALIAGASLHVAASRTDLMATVTPQPAKEDYTYVGLGPYETAAWTILPVALAGSGLSALGLLRRSGAVSDYCRNRRRWTYGRGWAVGTLSSLLLATLIAKWAFTARTGSPCAVDWADNRCSFAQQIGVGWGFSIAWTVGLGLSIGLRPSGEEK